MLTVVVATGTFVLGFITGAVLIIYTVVKDDDYWDEVRINEQTRNNTGT